MENRVNSRVTFENEQNGSVCRSSHGNTEWNWIEKKKIYSKLVQIREYKTHNTNKNNE